MEESVRQRDRRWYVLVTVGIGTFLSSLNTSITNTILPVMERKLNISLNQSAWVVLIYLLVLTLFLLPIGRLSDLVGHRRIFLAGFAVFTIAAVICGLSPNYVSLLWGRALLALAGAMILSVGPALISTSFPPEQRGRVLGIQAIMTYIGLSLGPFLGGWITQWWGWPVTFYLTVPFGFIGFVLGVWAVPNLRVEHRQRMDVQGFLTFIIGMAAVTLLLNSNSIRGHRALVLSALFVIFATATWAFVVIERRQPAPMLNLRLFRIRNFGFGTLGAALNYLCFFLTLFLLPYYFDHVLHRTAATTGTYLAIAPLVMTVCAPIAGALSDRLGPRPLTTAGMFFSIVSLTLFGFVGEETGLARYITIIIGLIFAGLGTGTFAAPNNSAILSAASRPQQGVASGTLATSRYVGMMAGITVGGSLFDWLLGHFAQRPDVTATLAFRDAFSVVMWIGAGFGVLGIICAWLMTNVRKQQA